LIIFIRILALLSPRIDSLCTLLFATEVMEVSDPEKRPDKISKKTTAQ